MFEKISDVLSNGITIDNFTVTYFDIIEIVVILALARVFLWLVSKYYQRRFKNSTVSEKGRLISLKMITRYFVWTLSIVLVFSALEVDVTILLAGSAALLVGLGLGIQHIFNDLVSGFIILFDRTIKVGDIVEINDLIGIVKEIGVRTSKVETLDKIWVVVPNSKFVNDNVINWSTRDYMTRFRIKVGVAYGSDVELVRRLLTEIGENHPKVMKEPGPFVEFNDFGDSALIFNLTYYTTEVLPLWKLKSDIRFEIDKKFRENKIKIPFPQREVYVNKIN